jgi:hypothetical protein
MAANTGRTVSKWMKFQIDDSAGTMRDIPVWTFNGIGIEYDSVELTALQDAMHGFLPGHGTIAVDITGPFDTTAAVAASGTGAAPTLSGSHVVLSTGARADGVPRGFGVYFGMRQYWETGEPVFGLTQTGNNGIQVLNYQVHDDLTYSCTLAMYPNSAVGAWGTTAIA